MTPTATTRLALNGATALAACDAMPAGVDTMVTTYRGQAGDKAFPDSHSGARGSDSRVPLPEMSPAEYDLRAAVVTDATGRAEVRVFRSPQDAEGVTLALPPVEAQRLARALTTPGFHPIARAES